MEYKTPLRIASLKDGGCILQLGNVITPEDAPAFLQEHAEDGLFLLNISGSAPSNLSIEDNFDERLDGRTLYMIFNNNIVSGSLQRHCRHRGRERFEKIAYMNQAASFQQKADPT